MSTKNSWHPSSPYIPKENGLLKSNEGEATIRLGYSMEIEDMEKIQTWCRKFGWIFALDVHRGEYGRPVPRIEFVEGLNLRSAEDIAREWAMKNGMIIIRPTRRVSDSHPIFELLDSDLQDDRNASIAEANALEERFVAFLKINAEYFRAPSHSLDTIFRKYVEYCSVNLIEARAQRFQVEEYCKKYFRTYGVLTKDGTNDVVFTGFLV